MAVGGKARLGASSALSNVTLWGIAWSVQAKVAGIALSLAVCEDHLESPGNTVPGLGDLQGLVIC